MFDRPDRVLVMVDGDLPSVVAAAKAKQAAPTVSGSVASGPVLWPAMDPSDADRRAACVRLASALGLGLLERRSRSMGPDQHGWTSPSRLLLDACTDAATAGRSEVIWPVQFPSVEIDAITRAVDRALLVTRLMALDASMHATPFLHVETPFVDLSDAQVADLAADLSAPVACCWWWGGEGNPGVPLAYEARARWHPALRSAGIHPESVVR
jgi:hypothetical protein